MLRVQGSAKTSKRTLTAVGAIAAGCLLALWWALADTAATNGAAAVSALSVRAAVEEFGPPPLAGVEHLREASPPLDETLLRRDMQVADVPADATRVLLRGKVEVHGGDTRLATVVVDREAIVRGRELAPLRAELALDGTFELDVTQLVFHRTAPGVFDGTAKSLSLLVRALHPGLLPATESVSTRAAIGAARGSQIVLDVVLRLGQQACELRGSVTTEDATRPAIMLAVFSVDGRALGDLLHDVQLPASGEFELALPAGERVLVAYANDWRPTTTRVTCFGDVPREIPMLLLERGPSISGRATLGGAPIERATLQAQLTHRVAMVAMGSASFDWTGERFEWSSRSARTDARGNFEITGLGYEPYSIALLGIPGALVQKTQALVIQAPAQAVEIAPSLCALNIEVYRHGQRSSQVRFEIHERRGAFDVSYGTHLTDAEGRALLWLAPGHETEIVIDDDEGFENVFTVPSCTSHESFSIRLDL